MPKAAKISLVVAVVLLGLLLAADRVLAFVAGNVLTDKVSQQLTERGVENTGELDATVGGFPFLTQVLGGKYDAVEIRAANLRSQGVSLTDLTVRATGVEAPAGALMRGEGTVTAARVTGSGLLPYSSIAALLHQPDLTIVADNGRLKLRTPIRFAGQSIMVVASGNLVLDGGRLTLTIEDIRPDGGGLPPGAQLLLSALRGRLSQEIALPPLPYGLTIERLDVAGDGLQVQVSAVNVPLSG